jgi:hypothetical protein
MIHCVSMDRHPPIKIVPDGDCILIVGREKTKSHVNSQVPSHTSESFRTMLEPGWKEGLISGIDPALLN